MTNVTNCLKKWHYTSVYGTSKVMIDWFSVISVVLKNQLWKPKIETKIVVGQWKIECISWDCKNAIKYQPQSIYCTNNNITSSTWYQMIPTIEWDKICLK